MIQIYVEGLLEPVHEVQVRALVLKAQQVEEVWQAQVVSASAWLDKRVHLL